MILNKRRVVIWGILCIAVWGLTRCNQPEDLTSGKEIYRVYCVNCHGADGSLSTSGALDLSRSRLPVEGRIDIIKNGRVTMMGFKNVLTQSQIDSVAHYTLELLKE